MVRLEGRRLVGLVIAAGVVAICLAVCLFLLLADGGSSSSMPGAGSFGIVVIDIDDSADQSSFHVAETGVYVLSVDEGSIAERSGILSGDRIISIGDAAIVSSEDFIEQCSKASGQASLSLKLKRANVEEPITVEIVNDTD